LLEFAHSHMLALVEHLEPNMQEAADRMRAMRRQLLSRVSDALDDVSPDLAESAVGRIAQAGVLVELAARLLSDQLGPDIASRMVSDLAQRSQAAR
jgi:hypothetical protein